MKTPRTPQATKVLSKASDSSRARPRRLGFLSSILATCLLLLAAGSVMAQSGTWTNTAASAVWSDSLNWLNGTIADGSGSTADFSTIDVPAGITVTLDTVRTNANLLFGDTNTATLGNWTLTDGGIGYTLDNTTSSNSIITVNTAAGSATNLVTGAETVTLAVNLSGTNTLVKAGPGRLILNPSTANSQSGGTVISNGMIELGIANTAGTANANTLGTGPIIFRGGALRLQNAAIPGNNPGNGGNGVSALSLPIIVETGQTGSLYLSCRAFPAFNGTVTGGGTLNVFADFVRDNLEGDWSAFTGQLNIIPTPRQATEDFRFGGGFVPAGLANARVNITSNVLNNSTLNFYNNGVNGAVYVIGELSCSIPNFVTLLAANTGAGAGNSLTFVLQIGRLNTTATFSGNFSAPGAANGVGIIKEGTGTWILNGQTIENNGMMVVSNGVLQIGSGTSGKLGRTTVVSNYATLAFGRSDTLVVTNVIDGPGTLEQRGSGSLILAPTGGTNTYIGKTVVTSGLLVTVPEAALGPNPASPTADQLTLNGGGLRSTNNQTLGDSNRGITLGSAGGTLGPDTNTTLTIASVIAGSGSLTINGAGTATLTGANTYSGKTILKAGTLALTGESFLGAAPGAATADQLTLNGGVLRSTATFAIDDSNRGITIGTSGGTIAPDASTTLTISEPIAGSGLLTKSGVGTLVINGADTQTGNMVISQGSLAVGASGSIAGPRLITIASGATLDVSASGLTLGSGQTLGGNGTMVGTVTAGTGSTLSAGASVGILTNSGNLTLNGGATNLVEISSSTNDVIVVSGNLTLNGVNTINLVPLSTLPAGTYSLIKYGGTLTGGAGNLALAGYPLSRLPASLVVDTVNRSINLVVTGSSGTLVWTGGLTGNAWDVNTTANWLNGAAKDVFFNGDSVSFTDVGATNPTVNLVASVTTAVTVNSGTDYTLSGTGKMTGLSTLTKSGTDKLTVLTTNDYTGTTAINSGTVQVGNGTASGSLGTGNVTDNSSLVYNLPGSLTASSAISGSGSLTLQAGTLILSGANAYGATVINNGTTLQVGNGGASGALGIGGVTDNGALIYKRTGTVTNAGSISGGGGLAVQSGTVVLAANNSYAGPTTIDTGTLQVGAGGTSGTLGSAASVTLTNGGSLAFNRSDSLTNIVAIVGTNGALIQAGTGTLVITNDNNDFGTTIVSAGKLQIGDGVNPSGTIGRGNVTVTNAGILVFNRPDVITFTNRVAGNGSVSQIGPTNLLITTPGGANTYSGGTTISNSTIVMLGATADDAGAQTANANGLGTGLVTFLGNSTLRLDRAAGNQDPGGGGGSGTVAYPLTVPAGQSGTLVAPGRYTLSSVLTGAGTFNLAVNYVRGEVTGNWSNFTGQINIVTNPLTTATVFDFRIGNAIGFPNAKVNLSNTVAMYSRVGNVAIPVGELSGTTGALLEGTSGSAGTSAAGNNATYVVGGLNTDAIFNGNIIDGNSIRKVGTGKWTLAGANSFTGTTTVSNGVLALSGDGFATGVLSGTPTITVASPGRIDPSGMPDDTFRVGESAVQLLQGNGTIQDFAYIGVVGTLAPGFSTNGFGTLTVTTNLLVDGAVTIYIDHTTTAVNSSIISPHTTINGLAALNVIQVGTNYLQTGDTFKLFSVPISGPGFGVPNLPLLSFDGAITYTWTNKLAIDGTIQLLSGATPTINANSTNIVFLRTGNTLQLSWPSDHTGWRLQAQTNPLTIGISTNWADVAGSTLTNQVFLTIDPTKGSVFYRLVFP